MATFKEGSAYVSIEGRSTILGVIVLSLYCVVVCQLLMRFRFSAVTATGSSLVLWHVMALGFKILIG